MTLARARLLVPRVLDRPGGRTLLAALATRQARRATNDTVKVFHDGVWVQRFGDDFLATNTTFRFMHPRKYEARVAQAHDCWFHLYRPRRGDVVVDVGAGDGLDTVVFSRSVGEEGRVVSVEAHPDTFGLLTETVRWNGLKNVTLDHSAIVDNARPVFVDDQDFHEFNSIDLQWTPGRRSQAVAGTSLDDLCERHGVDRISFLKVNIEGAEVLALQGMERMLESVTAVCIACHDFLADDRPELRTRAQVVAVLEAHGFDTVTRDDDPRSYVRDHVHGFRRSHSDQPARLD
jgi:FkbM family methyltransferase